MKKIFMIAVIIVLILLLPVVKNTFNKFMTQDKVLVVGHYISDHAFEFTKEIKDEEKIAEFENLFDQVKFSSSEWDEDT